MEGISIALMFACREPENLVRYAQFSDILIKKERTTAGAAPAQRET
jgi:hypothetical protein